MNRKELYKRTIGYASNGLVFVGFASYFIIPIFIFIAIMRPENSLNLLISLVLFYVPAFAIIFLIYRKYFLDLLFCSTEKFSGPLYLGEKLPSRTMAQANDLGRRWWVIEQKKVGIPHKFIIFPLILKNIYSSTLLLLNDKKGIFTITYMKRSKCIVEIRQPEPMHISYQPLWNTLKARGMKKDDLLLSAGLTTNMIANIEKGEHISMKTLLRICKALDCDISDVIVLEQDESPGTGAAR